MLVELRAWHSKEMKPKENEIKEEMFERLLAGPNSNTALLSCFPGF